MCTHPKFYLLQHGESALHIAAGYGRSSIVKLLCESRAYVDGQDKVGRWVGGVQGSGWGGCRYMQTTSLHLH